ncbi:MAG: hypothetical protein KBD90_01140 [Alphaproteobacteria bacterium]|nr:hypothetical protein [Alphaproteobacteria bacterium]
MKLNLKTLSLSILMGSTMISGASAMEEILDIKTSILKQKENKHTIVVSVEEGQCDDYCFSLHSKILERAWDIIKPTKENKWIQQDIPVEIKLSNGKTFLFVDDFCPGSSFPNPHTLMIGTQKTQGTYIFKDSFYSPGHCIVNCGDYYCDHETFPGIEMYNFSFKLTDRSPSKIEEKEIILSPLPTIPLIPTEKYPFIEHKLFSKYDETTKLWTYLEPVTEKNREYFISVIKHHGDVILRPLYKQHEMHNHMSMIMPFEGGGDGYFSSQPTVYYDDPRMIFQDDNELPDDQIYKECRDYFKKHCDQNTHDFDNASYNALRTIDGTHFPGFNNGETWVAYSMSEPLSGKSLAEDEKWLTLPSVQMFVTIKMSDRFYSPVGIFRNPTAIAYDKMKQIKRGPLGVPFHKDVAYLVKEANPNTQAMITRPLPSMAKGFKESGISFITTSSGFPIEENQAFGIQHVYTNGGGYELKLNDKLFFIDSKHWFTTIPVLGGVLDNSGCPFVMTDIKNLLEWKPSKN